MSDEVARLERQIEAERVELGHMVQALAERFDMKARARDAARRYARAGLIWPTAAVAAGAGLIVAALLWWRRR
jgi:hypothetical protein